MVSSTCSFFQSFAGNLYPRRLLLHALLHEPLPIPAAFPASATVSAKDTSPDRTKQISFDSNIVMILSILLCALIFAVLLNSIIRCARRCSIRAAFESRERAPASQPANAGIDKKALKTVPILAYSTGLNLPECTICLVDFVPGERIRVLPKCDHGFHLRCIDKWLTSHTSCPNCRQCLIDTCRKIVRGNESSDSSEPVQQAITPLEPESLMINYRSIR